MGDEGIDIVLFDLGGVLIEVGGVGPMRALANIDSDEALWQRWLTSPWVRRFERGHCSAEDFAAGMVVEWGLDLSADDYLDRLRSWMDVPLPGAGDLLDQVRQLVPIGCLSNMNAVHWDVITTRSTAFDHFTYRFLSFELGLVKPDAELFDTIAARLPVVPARVLFLDDNTMNVEAAAAAGFVARRVQGLDQARRTLVDMAVLPH
jgi:glucose-1-phosphatase